MKLHKYLDFIKENVDHTSRNGAYIPTYEEAVQICSVIDPVFYESKLVVDEYNISVFNYRLAQYKDFINPILDNPEVKAYEMRGLTFIFDKDGSLYNHSILLEKFFNMNQVPESMYSIVKDYKIKFVNNKEDGSIASFIKLPNGKVVGKSKMGFDNDQANGINKIYKTNSDVKGFVDWTLDNDYIAIFEYVSPQNRIVLRYPIEELILLRLRDNKTGKHIDIRDHFDKIGSIRIAPFEDDFRDLDHLVELIATQVDKEGCIVSAEDKNGNDFFFKLKTPWYCERHGLLTEDLYRENILIKYILDDKIDDILGQIPEEEKEAHERIQKMILVVRNAISDKVSKIEKLYDAFLQMGKDRKLFSNKYIKHPEFPFVMSMSKEEYLKSLSPEEIEENYSSYDAYEKSLKRCDKYELAKEWVREHTKRLNLAREFLKERDPSLFFKDPIELDDN